MGSGGAGILHWEEMLAEPREGPVECKQCYRAAGQQARYILEQVHHMYDIRYILECLISGTCMISGTFWNACSVKGHIKVTH